MELNKVNSVPLAISRSISWGNKDDVTYKNTYMINMTKTLNHNRSL